MLSSLITNNSYIGDSRVYISFSNGGDVVAHIKAPVNKHFDITTTLYIPYINPNDSHVRFWRNFDNLRFWH